MADVDVQNMPKTISGKEDREWFVLFSICVAGKSAKQTREKLNQYLSPGSPFLSVQWDIDSGMLDTSLRAYKFGQYKRIEKAFREVVKLDVMKDLTVEKLEAIPGIGPKTARFIVLYTDPEADCVPLDTHILKYLAKKCEGTPLKIPKSTPPAGKIYNALEELFRGFARQEGKSVRQLDTEVWQSYARA